MEFHPCVLTEPCAKVSLHTALLVYSQMYYYTFRIYRLPIGNLAVILFHRNQSSHCCLSSTMKLKQAKSFAPPPLQRLRHYYGLVCHRYLILSLYDCFPLRLAVQYRLLLFHTKPCIAFLSTLPRMPCKQ